MITVNMHLFIKYYEFDCITSDVRKNVKHDDFRWNASVLSMRFLSEFLIMDTKPGNVTVKWY